MKIIGLTGGIGSGKTTVAKLFKDLGVPIYIADIEAKKLTNSSKVIRRKLIDLLGEDAYVGQELNRKFVADKIFNDKGLLASVNAIIHPKVVAHFKKWVSKQKSPYVIKEAAILFENGRYKNCDLVILVTAPKEVRISRVMERDNASSVEIEQRMKNQWSDEKKQKLADLIIDNINLQDTRKRVEAIHRSLI
ncbi:dephospho-CoA kinase [Aequorivita sublithincola DSM 14238]|uniref:Dephospho-CoA kinase n=1 Tax=Aequorivita sublithincola (strain DSM 14238 / LMG 21431 / ACAM 643 / 9-3) TaxID=746697 RepID=I3Z081_AEQSU|nr:dephospho-CoA kinase [Aequorivita sublithincola]AFL82649.1 dephospho-CoA kinase [Aequorivita sublithincola DSM 14238]